jgi:alpha-mannosidase
MYKMTFSPKIRRRRRHGLSVPGLLGWLAVVFFSTGSLHGQDLATLRALHSFAESSAPWLEGYGSAGNANSFVYQSLQADCSDAMITRATAGVMPIRWNTAPVPAGYDISNGATFLFLVDRDMGETKVFDVFVDGIKKFSFGKTDRPDWTVWSPDGGKLSYATFARDVYGDSRGYMTLHAPASWLQPGQPLHLRISALAASSQAWFMVFRAPDAAAFLRNRLAYEGFFRVQGSRRGGKTFIRVKAAVSGAAPLVLQWGAERHQVAARRDDSVIVYAHAFSISSAGRLRVYSGNTMLFSTDTLFGSRFSNTVSERGIVLRHLVKASGGDWEEDITRSYRPQLATRLDSLSGNYRAGDACLLMNSSHQDIAWMDSPQKCILMRDTLVITPALKRMEQDKGYHFDIEDVLMIREYVKRHPDSREKIRHFLEDGQLNVGGSFNMPYEDMYGAESLVREFYQGARWMQQQFHYRPVTYWNVDVPGRTLQMPQILSRAGIGMMVLSRMQQGLYRWKAPDGSSEITYSPGHYNDLYAAFQYASEPNAGLNRVAGMTLDIERQQASWGGGSRRLVPLLWDSDMLPPGDDDGFPRHWNNLAGMTDNSGAPVLLRLPRVRSVTSRHLYQTLKAYPRLPSLQGERPDAWVYIHGPSHERALHASRDADILLPAAEKFLTVDALLSGSFNGYPAARLARAWEAKIYPDHGWGGYHGDITDHLFLQKFLFAREEGKGMLEAATRDIAGRIRFAGAPDRHVVLFNSLSWARSGPAEVTLHFREGEASGLRLADDSGRAVAVQLKDENRYADHSLASATLCFIARVPAVGYRSYHVIALKKAIKERTPDTVAPGAVFQSDHYRLRLGDGGLASVFDKDLQAELLTTGKFLGGEVFTMRSIGNGAGEFADIQQPDMEGFDKTSLHRCPWKLVADGPVYTAVSYRCHLKYADVRQTVILYKHLKRIDFKTDLLNWQGVLYREFREAFPLKMRGGAVDYAVPFGVVHVGSDELHRAAGERYTTDCRLVHPRGIDAWIGAVDSSHSVSLSSDVAVADYVDPTSGPVTYPVLQPVLLASRKSCNSRGNEYLQTGDHHFTFSLVSAGADSLVQDRNGLSAHVPFFTVADPPAYAGAALPETESFAASTGSTPITAIKKAEDANAVCFRLYNASGVPVHTSLHFFLPLAHTEETDLIENPLHPLQANQSRVLNLTLKPHEIKTFVSRISR